MGPLRAISTCIRKSFDFGGRAKRPEYWWFFLVVVLTALIPVVGPFLAAALAPAYLAVCWRRMHDIGRPGVACLAPLIGVAVILLGVLLQRVVPAGVLLTLFGVLVFANLMIQQTAWLAAPSAPGANRYGDGDGARTWEVFD